MNTCPRSRDDHGRSSQQHHARQERCFPRACRTDQPLADDTACDGHDAVQRAHGAKDARKLLLRLFLGNLPALLAAAEVGQHPALKDAEQEARGQAPQDAAGEQQGQMRGAAAPSTRLLVWCRGEERRRRRHRGQQAGQGVGGAEEEAGRFPAEAVGGAAGEGGRHATGEEAGGEEGGDEAGRNAVFIVVQRVKIGALWFGGVFFFARLAGLVRLEAL